MKVRRIPLRKCVACQSMHAKKELIRIVRTPDEQVALDLTGKKSGRGAYLCGKVECFQLAKRTRALDRALKHTVHQDVYDLLEEEFVRAGTARREET